MQDLNADMEELLQQAAADYPLQNGPDRWDTIAGQLLQKPVEKINKKNTVHFIQYTSVLFLLLFSFIILDDPSLRQNKIKRTQQVESKNSYVNKLPAENPGANSTAAKVQPVVAASDPKITFNTNRQGFDRTTAANIYQFQERPVGKLKSFISNESGDQQITAASHINENEASSLPVKTAATPNDKKEEAAVKTGQEIIVPVSVQIPGLSLQKNNAAKGFYFGIEAGIGVNAIRDQGFFNGGFKAGFIAGYRLNTSFSLESGIAFSQKKYATKGAYFNMDEMHKISPLVDEIIDVKGTSLLIELPLLLRYNIIRKNNHRLFSTIGLSSYIMTIEKNHYNVMTNGIAQPMHSAYLKDRIYYAASLDIGLGLEKDFLKKTQIRFEPFLQLPIGGIGIGKLPIKTVGIKVGITRSRH